ncbi:MAG: DUF4912 domain-containing protein [Spirochaetales bacterium]
MERERLEALSNEALRKLAILEGLEVPEDVERILLIDALLEVLEEKQEEQEIRNNSLMQVSQKKYDLTFLDFDTLEGEPFEIIFPICYHETKIQFLLRDPFWAYVYWDVKGGSLSALKKEIEAEKVSLRIFRLKGQTSNQKTFQDNIEDFFDIELGTNDYSWYVNLPIQDAYYCAGLVLATKQKECMVAQSNIQYVPPIYSLEELLVSASKDQHLLYQTMELEKLDILNIKQDISNHLSSKDEILQY